MMMNALVGGYCGYAGQRMNSLSVEKSDDPSHRPRDLDAMKTMCLYHQTDPHAAEEIILTNVMKCGQVGKVGGGIYFALAVEEAERKALHRGVILKCEVAVGAVKMIAYPLNLKSFTFSTLRKEGYDSIKLVGVHGAPGPRWGGGHCL